MSVHPPHWRRCRKSAFFSQRDRKRQNNEETKWGEKEGDEKGIRGRKEQREENAADLSNEWLMRYGEKGVGNKRAL